VTSLFVIATGDDQTVHHADWVEMQALRRAGGTVSMEQLVNAIKRPGFCTESRARDLAAEAFDELIDRSTVLQIAHHPSFARYPFQLTDNNAGLRVRAGKGASGGLLYLFLLAITRHSMDSRHRKQDGIDPTLVFERLCADVLLEFWSGRSLSSSFLRIGTGRYKDTKVTFKEEVDNLASALNEGSGWKPKARSPNAGDGGLDIAVWRTFRDHRRGAMVGFAQCKTGDNWRASLGKRPPRSFCGKYFADPLILDPLAVYMVPSRIHRKRWDDDMRDGNALLFDRCRIAECAKSIATDTLDDAKKWLDAIFSKADIIL